MQIMAEARDFSNQPYTNGTRPRSTNPPVLVFTLPDCHIYSKDTIMHTTHHQCLKNTDDVIHVGMLQVRYFQTSPRASAHANFSGRIASNFRKADFSLDPLIAAEAVSTVKAICSGLGMSSLL